MMDNENTQVKSHKKLIISLCLVAVCMFGFGYALVPIYNVLCKSLGINGKTGGQTTMSTEPVDMSRTITVQFLSTLNKNISWDFKPHVRRIELRVLAHNENVLQRNRCPGIENPTVQLKA